MTLPPPDIAGWYLLQVLSIGRGAQAPAMGNGTVPLQIVGIEQDTRIVRRVKIVVDRNASKDIYLRLGAAPITGASDADYVVRADSRDEILVPGNTPLVAVNSGASTVTMFALIERWLTPYPITL